MIQVLAHRHVTHTMAGHGREAVSPVMDVAQERTVSGAQGDRMEWGSKWIFHTVFHCRSVDREWSFIPAGSGFDACKGCGAEFESDGRYVIG